MNKYIVTGTYAVVEYKTVTVEIEAINAEEAADLFVRLDENSNEIDYGSAKEIGDPEWDLVEITASNENDENDSKTGKIELTESCIIVNDNALFEDSVEGLISLVKEDGITEEEVREFLDDNEMAYILDEMFDAQSNALQEIKDRLLKDKENE